MQKFFTLALLLASFTFARACDMCGCANSGSYFGLMPQSHKSMVGLRYSRLNFETHPRSDYSRTSERFRITELYGRFYPAKRVQVMAFLPYRTDQQQLADGTLKKQQGPGDATLLANYNVLNTFMDREETRRFNHSVQLGGGIKLPTGRFRFDKNDPLAVANANFQPGTGSTDFILNAFYTLTTGKWGALLAASHKLNTTNARGYRFGNQTYGSVDVYRTSTLGKVSLMPHLGIYAEQGNYGTLEGKILRETGGQLLNGTAGVSVFATHWTAGLSVQQPLAQNLSQGEVVSQTRALVQVAWLF
jgi:hypothetical protein